MRANARCPLVAVKDDEDPFLPAGFVSTFSAFSLDRHPVLARSASTFSGLLAELERALTVDSVAAAASNSDPAGPMVSLDSLRAYLQIVDVASILRLERGIPDHAFELFKDCSSATCLRNRSVEALATYPRGAAASDALQAINVKKGITDNRRAHPKAHKGK